MSTKKQVSLSTPPHHNKDKAPAGAKLTKSVLVWCGGTGQTKAIAAKMAKEILSKPLESQAVIFALNGNLGSGKTTFVQGFAKGLGIEEKITSPTFVILKRFKIPTFNIEHSTSNIQHFYHFDCYRIEKPEEILELGFEEIIKNPKNIVAIEWPEKIANLLPKDIIKLDFKFKDKNKREILIK